MAIIAVMLGGTAGFIAFLASLLLFNASLLTACAIYMATGIAIATVTIAMALIPDRTAETGGQPA